MQQKQMHFIQLQDQYFTNLASKMVLNWSKNACSSSSTCSCKWKYKLLYVWKNWEKTTKTTRWKENRTENITEIVEKIEQKIEWTNWRKKWRRFAILFLFLLLVKKRIMSSSILYLHSSCQVRNKLKSHANLSEEKCYS